MIKKIAIVLAAVALIAGAFVLGWNLQSRQTDNEYNAAIRPATQLVDSMISGDNLKKQYESTSSIYKETVTEDQFTKSVALLKDGVIVSNNTYNGSIDNFILYELTQGDKTYDISVTTAKADDVWAVTSLQISEQVTD